MKSDLSSAGTRPPILVLLEIVLCWSFKLSHIFYFRYIVVWRWCCHFVWCKTQIFAKEQLAHLGHHCTSLLSTLSIVGVTEWFITCCWGRTTEASSLMSMFMSNVSFGVYLFLLEKKKREGGRGGCLSHFNITSILTLYWLEITKCVYFKNWSNFMHILLVCYI